jgi:iron complex outermembrane recepter protein
MLLILIVMLCSYGFAQDSVYTLSPVEITDVRTGINNYQAFNLVEKEDIQRGETGISLEDALYIIPGITVINRNNPSMGDKISIRGIGSRASFGVRGIKMMLDNIPLTMPDGQSQINNIDLMSAGRVDILKGPASSFYGNASGGVIRLYTEIPSEQLINIEPRILAGSDDLYKYTLKLSGTSDSHSYLVSFNNTSYEGYRENGAQKSYHLNSVYKNKLTGDILLSAVINYYNSPYQQNPSTLDKESVSINRRQAREFIKQQGAGQRTNQFQGGINLDMKAGGYDIESTVYYVRRNLLNPIPGRIIDLKRNAGGFRTAVNKQMDKKNIRMNFTGGVDIEHQSDKRNEYVNEGVSIRDLRPSEIFDNLIYGNRLNNQKESITGVGPFLAAEFLLYRRIGLIAVIRYDNYNYKVTDYLSDNSGSRIMEQVSPSAGIMYKPDLYSRIFLNYSTSFQTPTAVELSNRPDGKGGFNPSLEPEKIRQWEIGGEYLFERINSGLSASVYIMNFDDLLIPYQSTASEEIFYRNAGKAVNKGVEVKADVQLVKTLSASISYNYMDFRFSDYIVPVDITFFDQLKGNNVPGIPLQTVSMRLSYNTESGFWGKLALQWNDEYYTNDYNGPPPSSNSPAGNFINESYIYSDLRAGYLFNLKNFSIDIFTGIDNLADRKYNGSVVPNAAGERFFEPAPQRTFYAGIALQF